MRTYLLGLIVLMGSVNIAWGTTSEEYFAQGNALNKDGKYEEAAKSFQQAVKADPKNAKAFQNLGNVYYQLGRNPEAIQAYEKCLSIDPNNKELSGFVAFLKAKTPASNGEVRSGTVSAPSTVNAPDGTVVKEGSVMAGSATKSDDRESAKTEEGNNENPLSGIKVYDRLSIPGDLRKAVSLAVKTIAAKNGKARRSVFLALEKVSRNKDDKIRKGAYVRFNIDRSEFIGPRNDFIVLAGTATEQSGDDCAVGDPVQVAIDFKDIKIDYEGSKLGEIQKGNDIAGQVFEVINSHASYQLVLIAQDQVKDAKYHEDSPVFLTKAKIGYAFLDFPNDTR